MEVRVFSAAPISSSKPAETLVFCLPINRRVHKWVHNGFSKSAILLRKRRIFYVRKRIPKELIGFYGRAFFQRSLRTSDRVLAVRLSSKIIADLEREWLEKLLVTIKERHPDIAHLICSGAGLRLMNIDARICEYVIADFVSTGTPILTIHDSFIVPVGSEERLNEVMREAFNQVTGKDHIKVQYNQNLTKKSLYALMAQDRSFFQQMFWFMSYGDRPEAGYQQRRQRHIERYGEPDRMSE